MTGDTHWCKSVVFFFYLLIIGRVVATILSVCIALPSPSIPSNCIPLSSIYSAFASNRSFIFSSDFSHLFVFYLRLHLFDTNGNDLNTLSAELSLRSEA